MEGTPTATLMRHRYLLADVFTDRIFGGNPLAVFPEGDRVPEGVMQTLARELNLSETVFVLPPESPSHACRLRIFTPNSELPFAGHPTVGTACLLAETGRIPLGGGEARVVLEEGVGPIEVVIRREGDGLAATFGVAKLPERGPAPPPVEDVAAAVSLAPDDIVDVPEAYSCGVRFLCIPVRDREALGRAHLDPAAWQASIVGSWAPQLFLFTGAAVEGEADIQARMFAPGLGVPEDPATGSAAAALAGYISAREADPDASLRRTIAQGVEMGRPSSISLAIERKGGVVTAVRVGGRSVKVAEGAFELP